MSYYPPAGPCRTLLSLYNVVKGRYLYMEDLAQLQGVPSRPLSASRSPLLQRVSLISLPLHVAAWQELLANHPDERFQRFIVDGIHQGFHIGFNPSQPKHSPRKKYEVSLRTSDGSTEVPRQRSVTPAHV